MLFLVAAITPIIVVLPDTDDGALTSLPATFLPRVRGLYLPWHLCNSGWVGFDSRVPHLYDACSRGMLQYCGQNALGGRCVEIWRVHAFRDAGDHMGAAKRPASELCASLLHRSDARQTSERQVARSRPWDSARSLLLRARLRYRC